MFGRIPVRNLLFVDRFASRCGNCRANIADITPNKKCPNCKTRFKACVSEFVYMGREKQLCEDATDGQLKCIGIGSAGSRTYQPF